MNIQHGTLTVLRTPEQAAREELFMERIAAKRILRTLREQLTKARARRSKATPVPLDVLDQLLTKLENEDA